MLKNKLLKKCSVFFMAGALLVSGFGANKTFAHAQNVGGITVNATLSDGRKTEKTTATLIVSSGPPQGLSVEARIYYRFNKKAYYHVEGPKASYAPRYSVTSRAQRTPVTVDMCYGKYRVSYNSVTWEPIKTIGSKKTGVNYIKE
jgi:hypothetical protein